MAPSSITKMGGGALDGRLICGIRNRFMVSRSKRELQGRSRRSRSLPHCPWYVLRSFIHLLHCLSTEQNLGPSPQATPFPALHATAPRSSSNHNNALMQGTKDVRLDPQLNKKVWESGIKGVPYRLRVRISRKRNDEEGAKEKLYSYVQAVNVPSAKGLATAVVED
jgi:Ribosomal protein L31e